MARSRGFTLLEVLLALAIMSLILVASGGIFSVCLQIWRRSDSQAELAQAARVIVNRMVTDVQHSERVVVRSYPIGGGRWAARLELYSRHYLDEDDEEEQIWYDWLPSDDPPYFWRKITERGLTGVVQPLGREVTTFQVTPNDMNGDRKPDLVKGRYTFRPLVGGEEGGRLSGEFDLMTDAYLRNGTPY